MIPKPVRRRGLRRLGIGQCGSATHRVRAASSGAAGRSPVEPRREKAFVPHMRPRSLSAFEFLKVPVPAHASLTADYFQRSSFPVSCLFKRSIVSLPSDPSVRNSTRRSLGPFSSEVQMSSSPEYRAGKRPSKSKSMAMLLHSPLSTPMVEEPGSKPRFLYHWGMLDELFRRIPRPHHSFPPLLPCARWDSEPGTPPRRGSQRGNFPNRLRTHPAFGSTKRNMPTVFLYITSLPPPSKFGRDNSHPNG